MISLCNRHRVIRFHTEDPLEQTRSYHDQDTSAIIEAATGSAEVNHFK